MKGALPPPPMLLRLPPRQNVGPLVEMTPDDQEGFRFWQQQQRYFQGGAPPASTVHGDDDEGASGRLWCLILGVSCFVLLFVFLTVFWWWRPSGVVFVATKMTQVLSRSGGGGRGKGHCTTDEDFDERSQMCMMRAHFPRAVSETIMDTSVSPCQDIYRHACGKWIDEHTNENRGFGGLRALNTIATTEIVMDPKVATAHNLFRSCESTLAVDSQARRQRNWKSHAAETAAARSSILNDMLEPIATGNLKEGLPATFARMIASDYTVPLSFGFQGHPTDAGLIPALAYNGFDSASLDVEWVAMHFQQLYPPAQAGDEARKLVDMVAKLNMATPDMSTLNNLERWTAYVKSPQLDGDLMTWDTFKKSSNGLFNWETFLVHLEVRAKLHKGSLKMAPSQEVWAFSKSYFHWFHPEKFGAGQWKRFIQWSVLYHTHDYFPQLPRTSLFTGTALTRMARSESFDRRPSSPSKKRRTKRTGNDRRRGHDQEDTEGDVTTADCVEMTKFMLPGVVSQEYLKRNFVRGEQIRTRVKGVVEAIKARFVANIMGTQWMDAPTRRLQAEKIQAIVARVVHPNEWEAEQLDMRADQYLRNLNSIQKDRVRRNLLLWSESNNGAKCGPSCRDKITAFGTSLSTVNAWYNPDRNVITIPAGILQPPFFEERYDNVSVYATIGMVVAHELSHALDPHGSLFDKDGVMRDTWSEQARATYREKALCIVHEYGSPEGCNNAHYGEQTLCEDTADIVGVRLTYEALLEQGPLSKKDKQDFHVAFSQMWCASYEPGVLCDTANNDVHAIASMRVRKTLAHIPYFAWDYDCPVGSPMHRTATERCAIYLNETLAVVA